MARDFPVPPTIERDGVSQGGRVQPALDPAYVSVDERSPRDLLALSRAFAKELVFFDTADQPAGDWSALLEQDLSTLAAMAGDVETASPVTVTDRPHLALFLAFLRLLGHPRDLVNRLTTRHLAFYYEELLRMSRKPALPDRAHVLFRLAAGVDRALVPGGTALRAGKDTAGRERVYRTDRDLVVGRAAVARLSSVYAQKEIVGLRDVALSKKGTQEDRLMRMWALALGDPRPGDPMPKFAGKAITPKLLQEVRARIDFADTSLAMDFSDLHALMRLVKSRAADAPEWAEINGLLEKAGKVAHADPTWKLQPANPRDFDKNLVLALIAPLDFKSDALPGVEDIVDLYDQRARQDCAAFIVGRVRLSVEDFARMMRVKLRVDAEWAEIRRILEQAGRRKRGDASFKIPGNVPPTDFPSLLAAALGPLNFAGLPHDELPAIDAIGKYYDAIVALEDYFHASAAQIGYVLTTTSAPVSTDGPGRAWDRVYRVLSDMHAAKVYADRRRALRTAQEAAPTRAEGLAAMLRIALGLSPDSGVTPDVAELKTSVAAPKDYQLLATVSARALAGQAISADEWARTYEIVELAQRSREGLPEPVPERETWLALHAAEDATSILASQEPGATRRWKTFGQLPRSAGPDAPARGALGWAIVSPALLLAQGTRKIALTLGFVAKRFDAAKLAPLFPANAKETWPFVLEVSTEKGWLAVPYEVAAGDYKALSQVARAVSPALGALQLKVKLDPETPALAPPSEGGPRSAARAQFPMLRITLRRIFDSTRAQDISLYEPFRDLRIEAAHLRTEVDGLTPQALQSDDAALDPKKPFEPFGSSPAVGSRFRLADPELSAKRLDTLAFDVLWRGAPKSLASHYANYLAPTATFRARISMVDNQVPLALGDASLVNGDDGTAKATLAIADVPAALDKEKPGFRYAPRAEIPKGAPASAWPRHFAWELLDDFKHSSYSASATQKALELTTDILKSPSQPKGAPAYLVNPPYTPKVQSLRVRYTAQIEVADLTAAPGEDRLFHVHPFGVSAIAAEGDATGIPFLPRYDDEGELYIGLSGAEPPETVSLLFQMVEGSADPDLTPSPIAWSFLDGDAWRSLHQGQLELDTTYGLIDSGVVRLALPKAAKGSRLPDDLTWIRASIASRAGAVCDAVAVHAQAVSATFAGPASLTDELSHRVPEKTITGLVQRAPAIAAVEQPYPSWGGRGAEAEGDFRTRVSERLRHKQRAVTTWDYERLVLERFPGLYKVKCIPASADDLGAVTVVVIPQVHGEAGASAFEPKVPAATLAEIERYLRDKRPPGARVRVENARFVPVKIRVGVRFRSGGDEGFYKKQLNEELNRFLSPWAFEEGADIVIGGKIYASSIVSFLDGRPYVDYVAAIKLFSAEDTNEPRPVPPPSDPASPEGYYVTTHRPDGVLVAWPEHDIDILGDGGLTAESFTGIDYMKIELDFVIAGSP